MVVSRSSSFGKHLFIQFGEGILHLLLNLALDARSGDKSGEEYPLDRRVDLQGSAVHSIDAQVVYRDHQVLDYDIQHEDVLKRSSMVRQFPVVPGDCRHCNRGTTCELCD